jgi:hypothetical protein
MAQRFYEDRDSAGRAGMILADFDDPCEILMRAEEDGDDDEQIDLSGIRAIPRDALKTLMIYLIPPGNRAKRLRIAQLRLVLLAHACGVDGIAEYSFAKLAEDLQCTRALLSYYAVRMADELGEEAPRGGKRRVSRDSYRQSALAAHRRAGHKMRSDSDGDAS